jgi:hypothetical protein
MGGGRPRPGDIHNPGQVNIIRKTNTCVWGGGFMFNFMYSLLKMDWCFAWNNQEVGAEDKDQEDGSGIYM